MSKDIRPLAGYLRVVREDVQWITAKAGHATPADADVLLGIITALEADIGSLRETLEKRK